MGVNKDELVRLMAEGTLHSSVMLLKRESKEMKWVFSLVLGVILSLLLMLLVGNLW